LLHDYGAYKNSQLLITPIVFDSLCLNKEFRLLKHNEYHFTQLRYNFVILPFNQLLYLKPH